MKIWLASWLGLALSAPLAAGEGEPPRRFEHQITGLFAPHREAALRRAFAKIAGVKLVRLDVEDADATLEYAPETLFPDAKPDQYAERLDNLLRPASDYTFGIRPARTVPREKLRRIEIRVAGLDCDGCALSAYEAIGLLEGVEAATVSFREGRISALVDPEKVDRPRLEDTLRRRGVEVVAP